MFKRPFSEDASGEFTLQNLGLSVFSRSAGKNRKPQSATRLYATKPQVTEA